MPSYWSWPDCWPARPTWCPGSSSPSRPCKVSEYSCEQQSQWAKGGLRFLENLADQIVQQFVLIADHGDVRLEGPRRFDQVHHFGSRLDIRRFEITDCHLSLRRVDRRYWR